MIGKLSFNPSNGVCSLDFLPKLLVLFLFQILTVKILEYLTIDSTKSIDLNLSNRP